MLTINDALDAVLVGCFLFGLIFSVASLLLGFVGIGGDGAHPGDGQDGLDVHHGHGHGDGFGALNLSSLLAFVTWFGGVGYIARNGFGWVAPLSLLAAVLGGLAGGAAITWFFAKVVRADDGSLDPEAYQLPGTLARVNSSIREAGTGEIIYEQGGVRQVAAARSVDGRAIPRGTDVVVLQTERGVALVEPWETLLGDGELIPHR